MTGFYPYNPFNQAFLTFHGDQKDMIGIMIQFIKSLAVQPENLN